MMRKPVSSRVPPVDHMACMTGHGMARTRRRKRPIGPSESMVTVSWCEAPAGRSAERSAGLCTGIGVVSSGLRSPKEESTRAGRRIAWTVPTTNMTKAARRAHAGPTHSAAPPITPPTTAPSTPAIDTFEFALTSVVPGGSSRGTAAALAMVYAFDATRQPRAAGKSHPLALLIASASTQQRKARAARVVPMAQRRPWLKRSSNGPMSGAVRANGTIVNNRKNATCPRACAVCGLKNRVPASASVIAVSPAAWLACSSVSRARPLAPAPPEWV